MTRASPAVARLADDLLVAIAAICAARTRERIVEAAGRLEGVSLLATAHLVPDASLVAALDAGESVRSVAEWFAVPDSQVRVAKRRRGRPRKLVTL